MPQDAFHIRRLSAELSQILVGGKINRISQVDKDELTFIIYTKNGVLKLILSANATGARVCVSKTEKDPAPVAPNFCMLLRKHLQNAQILSVTQCGFERIIEITLHCTSDFSECERVLHCELMGKYSNIVLTEKGVILGALKTTALLDESHRVLLSGAKYLYPAPQDKISVFDGAGMRRAFENFFETHAEGYDTETLASYIFERIAGLALPTARELTKRLQDTNTPPWEYIPKFCEREPSAPCVQKRNGVAIDFFAFPVAGGEPTATLCEAEDEFFTGKETKKIFTDKKRRLESAIRALKKKVAKRLQDTLERLQDASNADESRIKGELLTANLYRIERGARSVELENWYDEQGGTLKIALDETLSPAQNAQKYFKIYNKRKRAREVLEPMRIKDEAELDYAESVIFSITAAEADEDLKEIEAELIEAGLLRAPKGKIGAKKKETPVPFRSFTLDNFTILAGRTNIQNDRLLREASPEDIWLHTQKYHSSHVIIRTENRVVPDSVLLYAAQICAYYSDGRIRTTSPWITANAST